jgi:hypothetical protein
MSLTVRVIYINDAFEIHVLAFLSDKNVDVVQNNKCYQCGRLEEL